jgi:hypothetical protein
VARGQGTWRGGEAAGIILRVGEPPLGPKPADPAERREWYRERGRRRRRAAAWTTVATVVAGSLVAIARPWLHERSEERSRRERADAAAAERTVTYPVTVTIASERAYVEGFFPPVTLPWPPGGDDGGDRGWAELRAIWERAWSSGRWKRLELRAWADGPERTGAIEQFREISAAAGLEFAVAGG